MVAIGHDYGFKKQCVKGWLNYHPDTNNYNNMLDDDGTGRFWVLSSEIETGGFSPQVGVAGQAHPISSRYLAKPRSPMIFDFTGGSHAAGYTACLREDYLNFEPTNTNAYNFFAICDLHNLGDSAMQTSVAGFSSTADISPTEVANTGAGNVYRITSSLNFAFTTGAGHLIAGTIDYNYYVTPGFTDAYPSDPYVRACVQPTPANGYFSYASVDAAGWGNAIAMSGVFQTVTIPWSTVLAYLTRTPDSGSPGNNYMPLPASGSLGDAIISGINIGMETNIPVQGNTLVIDEGLRNIHFDATTSLWILGSSRLGIDTILG
jgi:hypothetical protein